MVPEKGLDVLLEAWQTVQAQEPARTLVLIGDGPERLRLETFAAKHGLNVRFAGSLEHAAVAEVLAQASIFVFPSIREAFGASLLEAMAMGRPCIASAVDELLGDAGIKAAPRDAGALANAILGLLRDPAAAAALGQRAARRAHTKFGTRAWLDAHERIYQHAVAGRRTSE
jgi:glycosyltransferase involved in cell wall biosynthesis